MDESYGFDSGERLAYAMLFSRRRSSRRSSWSLLPKSGLVREHSTGGGRLVLQLRECGIVLNSLVETFGSWVAVPAATAALAGYGIALLTGMHRTKSQQRVEFLGM